MRTTPAVFLALIPAALGAAGCRSGTLPAEGVAAAAAPAEPGSTYKPSEPQLRFVKTAAVQKSIAGGITAATGRIAFDEDHTSRVASPVSGRVDELLVKPGDKVRKGQGLVVVASPDIDSALAEAREADADVTLAERALERAQGLYAEQAIPKKEVVQAEGDLLKSRAALERARGRLDLLGLKVDEHTSRFTLRAPVAGTVVDRTVLPGTEVRSDGGTPLLTISDLATLWVYADVYERDLALVHAGQKAEVRVASYPAEAFPARVAHVGDVVDPQTRTVKLRLSVDNGAGKLKPEMFARVTLSLDARAEVATVPSQAVLSDGESSVVIADLGGGQFEKRKVEVGQEQDGVVRVSAGLRPGDRVVTDGALFLKAEIENR